jgi:hypothetical protein
MDVRAAYDLRTGWLAVLTLTLLACTTSAPSPADVAQPPSVVPMAPPILPWPSAVASAAPDLWATAPPLRQVPLVPWQLPKELAAWMPSLHGGQSAWEGTWKMWIHAPASDPERA